LRKNCAPKNSIEIRYNLNPGAISPTERGDIVAQGKGALARKKNRRLEMKKNRKSSNQSRWSSGSSGSTTTHKVHSGPQNQWGTAKTPSTKKLFRGGLNPITKIEYKEQIQMEAKERNDKWASLSFDEQLKILAERTALGFNCARQITKINKKIAKGGKLTLTVKTEIKTEVVTEKLKIKAKDRRAKERKSKK